jgi:hypothetical protein
MGLGSEGLWEAGEGWAGSQRRGPNAMIYYCIHLPPVNAPRAPRSHPRARTLKARQAALGQGSRPRLDSGPRVVSAAKSGQDNPR